MYLSNQRYEEMKSEALNLIIYCHITSFPIDATMVIKKLGGCLRPYSSLNEERLKAAYRMSEDGFSCYFNGNWLVLYNDAKNAARIKMTLLHESAHNWLNHGSDSELAEAEAAFFAKYIIAPPAIIHQLNLHDSFQIMCHFGNSIEAAEYSLNYYQKWLQHSGAKYSKKELKLISYLQDYINETKQREVI